MDENDWDLRYQASLDIRKNLYARFPMAAFGPAHVCLDDENWDTYEQAIELTLLTLAYRTLERLDLEDLEIEWEYMLAPNTANLEIARRCDWYEDHGIEELAATLAALDLIREQWER